MEINILARILPPEDYIWHTYDSDKPMSITNKIGKKTINFKRGTEFGLRPSTSGSAIRMITKEFGPSIVFTLTMDQKRELIANSNAFKQVAASKLSKEDFVSRILPGLISGYKEIENLESRSEKSWLRDFVFYLNDPVNFQPERLVSLSSAVSDKCELENLILGLTKSGFNVKKSIAKKGSYRIYLGEEFIGLVNVSYEFGGAHFELDKAMGRYAPRLKPIFEDSGFNVKTSPWVLKF